MKVTTEHRFWNRVSLPDDDGCMVWSGALQSKGYGQIKINKKMVFVHRYSYGLNVGPIPDGLVIDHLCRNRACVRPDHLEAVTGRENVMRGEGLAPSKAAQTSCANGHEFTEANTYRWKTERGCRECRKENTRRYRLKGK